MCHYSSLQCPRTFLLLSTIHGERRNLNRRFSQGLVDSRGMCPSPQQLNVRTGCGVERGGPMSSVTVALSKEDPSRCVTLL